MLQALMKACKKADFPESDMEKDRVIIMAKTPDDLAESLEIMMIETRMIGMGRISLRGALCMMRDEPTNVPLFHALYVLRVLKARWTAQDWPQRELIVQCAIDIVSKKGGEKNA